MDQDATWYTEVGLRPGDIVLDGGPSPPTEMYTAAPIFRHTLLWYGRPSQQLTSELFITKRNVT